MFKFLKKNTNTDIDDRIDKLQEQVLRLQEKQMKEFKGMNEHIESLFMSPVLTKMKDDIFALQAQCRQVFEISKDKEDQTPPLAYGFKDDMFKALPGAIKHIIRKHLLAPWEISPRAFWCLKRAEITRVRDLLNKTEEDLLSINRFGVGHLESVKQYLKSFGLKLKASKEKE